jgi:ribosomal protein S18 acetylase RimI-like enzyme
MRMTVQIRPISSDDIEGFHHALDFVAGERRFLAALEAPSIEDIRVFVLGNIERGYPQIVAVAATRSVVGWCDVLPKPRPVYRHGGVLGMGLLPQYRGQGIGTKLIQRALAMARVTQLHRVELTVRESNANAIALYKKVGFVTEGLHQDAVCVDGAYENIVSMAILL